MFYYSTNISTFNDEHSTMKFNIHPKKIQHSTQKYSTFNPKKSTFNQKNSTFNQKIQHSNKKFNIQPKKFNIQPKGQLVMSSINVHASPSCPTSQHATDLVRDDYPFPVLRPIYCVNTPSVRLVHFLHNWKTIT